MLLLDEATSSLDAVSEAQVSLHTLASWTFQDKRDAQR
jgi:ABC-type bacteriocin/lantibiotic exporter with double-glycine peptidase domain